MHKKAFQLLVDNTSGVLSRISGLFSRRGYNIESITAGVTADPRYTRITIVASLRACRLRLCREIQRMFCKGVPFQ